MDPSEYRKRVQEELDRAAEESPRFRERLRQAAPPGARDVQQPAPQRSEDAVSEAVGVLLDRSADPERRKVALDAIAVEIAKRHDLVDLVLGVLRDRTEPPVIRRAALQVLRASSFRAVIFAPKRPDYLETLRSIVDDPDADLRAQALEVLAQEKDEYVQRRLLDGLRNPAAALVSAEKALQFLGYDVHADHFPLLRQLLQSAPSPEAKLETVRLLASDPTSKELLAGLLRDKKEPAEIRTASAAALRSLAPEEFEQIARDIVLDAGENDTLRASTISALDHFPGPAAGAEDAGFVERIRQLQAVSSGELQRAARRFVDKRKE